MRLLFSIVNCKYNLRSSYRLSSAKQVSALSFKLRLFIFKLRTFRKFAIEHFEQLKNLQMRPVLGFQWPVFVFKLGILDDVYNYPVLNYEFFFIILVHSGPMHKLTDTTFLKSVRYKCNSKRDNRWKRGRVCSRFIATTTQLWDELLIQIEALSIKIH